MSFRLSFLFIILLVVSGLHANGQLPNQGWLLKYSLSEEPGRKIAVPVSDSLESIQELENILSSFRKKGYLISATDSVYGLSEERQTIAIIRRGKRFKWLRLKADSQVEIFLEEIGFKTQRYAGKVLKPEEFAEDMRILVRNASNRGYPFAKLWLDSLEINDGLLEATLRADPYRRITYDSIRVAGTGKLSNKFVERWLGIRGGDIYDDRAIVEIGRRMNQLDFVRLRAEPRLYFYNDKALIDLLVEDRKVNQFEGIIGVFPNAQNSGKLRLTGDLKLALRNSLKGGEFIGLNWKSIQAGTQDLKIRLEYPFFLNTAFGPDIDFRLFYRDSSFLELNGKYGLRYLFDGGNAIKLFFQQRDYNVLDEDTLSPLADLETRLYGIAFDWNKLNSAINPTNGYEVHLSGAIGRKNVEETSLMETAGQSAQSIVRADLRAYFSGDGRFVTVLGFQSASLLNDQIYRNELLRFGGFSTLRGFEEEVLLASAYGIFSFEQRFMLADRSYFSAFWNASRMIQKTVNRSFSDWPQGFGVGMNFNLGNGVFSLLYALGTQKNTGIQLNSAKVHLGFTYLL